MRETKLYKALIQLSGHELNKLHRFIQSPYFNQTEPIISLYEILKADLKSNGEMDLDKEQVWKACYPNETTFHDGRFRKLQSDLLKTIEKFYAQEEYESNPILQAKYLMQAIINRNIDVLQTGSIKTAQRLTEEQFHLSASHYYYKYEIERNIYLLSRLETERSSKSNLENIVINLDKFYLAEKLRYASFILTHQHFAAVEYTMLFTDEIMDHVKNNDYSDVPAILIYYQILLTYKEPKERKHYDRLKDYLNKYIHLFPETEAREILDAVLNYGIIRMNAGEESYLREVFEIYRKSLETKLLLVKGKIDPFSYKNIVTIGLRLGEFNWIENFIKDGTIYLEEKFRQNALTFNLAQLYFYKKEYEKVIQQLSQVEYEDFTYSLNSKTLLMASYYELDEFEALNSFLDSFRLYVIRNKKLTQGKGKHYKNTISLVKKLMKIMPGNQAEIAKLKNEVLTTQGVVSKNWILEKLANLN